jgi:hypothetical protein
VAFVLQKALAKGILPKQNTIILYLFDFRRIDIYFLFCRTNSVRDLIFV